MPRSANPFVILALLAVLAGCAGGPRATDGGRLSDPPPTETVHLDEDGPADPGQAHRFGPPGGGAVSLALQSRARSRMAVALTCDGPARLRRNPADAVRGRPAPPPAFGAAGEVLRISLPPGRRSAPRVLDLGAEVTRCDLTVTPPGHPGYTLALHRAPADPALVGVDRAARAAIGAAGGPAVGLATVPLVPAGPLRLLTTGEQALAARIEALTGQRPDRAALMAGDPAMALDFSRAPQLDAIHLSYFYMNADFAGALMARMLAHHAARGTQVRILLSDTVIGAPERALFEGLAARYPSVQLQAYRFHPRPGDGVEDHVARLHRSNHAKIFVTRARDPARSVAIIGGRNWHESYLFTEPRDLSAFPALRQYVLGRHRSLVDFLPFADVELALRGAQPADAITRHFMALWHRDAGLAQGTGRAQAHPARAEHFLSMPYVDGRAQERLFIDLIDGAARRIDIASPFVNPSEGVLAALDRALARGVRVRVVTTMQMPGLDGAFITALAHDFAREWADRVELVDFGRDPQALHAKLYVFDEAVAIVGSVNINRRSFYHDIENGVILRDPAAARQVLGLIDGFAAQGHRVAADSAALAGPAGLLTRLRWLRRAF